MKLAEVMVAVAVFLIASVAITSTIINVRKGIDKAERHSREAIEILEADEILRKEIKKIEVPYWQNFEKTFKAKELQLKETLAGMEIKGNLEIVSVTAVRDEKYGAEGIRIQWKHRGKDYATQEFVKQRIIIDE
ncbi:MAG: hypothetical protein Q4B64_01820 [Spirochaetales bacterium]|nr:hypothetical protein [Spirochaetales bacterium]